MARQQRGVTARRGNVIVGLGVAVHSTTDPEQAWSLPRGVEALAVFSFEDSGTRWLMQHYPTMIFETQGGEIVGPAMPLPGIERAPGTVCLFARFWRSGALLPCLTLRATGGARPSIALEGLEHARSIGDAARLLKHLRFLERLAAGGPRQQDRRELVTRAESLRRQHPGMTWPQVAARLGVPVSSLHRWRANTQP